MTIEKWVDLRCHPSQHAESVRAVKVKVSLRRSADAELRLNFRLDGDISRISVPPPATPRIAKDLWRHTCFEAFVAEDPRGAYYELNFATSREWALYQFSGYRDGSLVVDETIAPAIETRPGSDCLEVDAIIRLDRLPRIDPHGALYMGLSAVIEGKDGLSYWAIRHPVDKPDFHHPDGFALRLEPV